MTQTQRNFLVPSGTKFLNSMFSVDSVSLHEYQFTVQKTEQQITKVSDILTCKDGTFNVSGRLTWQEGVRQPGSRTQSVRDALLTDDSGSIPVSV